MSFVKLVVSLLIVTQTIGQLIETSHTVIESDLNTEADRFGSAISIDGDWLAIAEYGDETGTASPADDGSVHLYKREGSASSPWVHKFKIGNDLLRDGDSTAKFGWGKSVSISGDTVAIGDASVDNTGNALADEGRVYIFKRSTDTSWLLEQTLSPDNPDVSVGAFGHALELIGDHLIVGDPYDDVGGTNSGTVYYFTRSGTTWTKQQILLHDGTNVAQENFGIVIAMNGDSEMFITSTRPSGGTYTYEGVVSRWTRVGSTWTQQENIYAPAGEITGNSFTFGKNAVCASNDLLCVSSYKTGINHMYCYARNGNTFDLKSTLDVSNASISKAAGSVLEDCVIVDDAYLVIGNTRGEDISTGTANSGQIVLFTRNIDDTWTYNSVISEVPTSAQAMFGGQVASGGLTLIVSAQGVDSYSGVVYSYDMVTPPPNCNVTTDCVTNAYCPTTSRCKKKTCSVHGDCFGLFHAGRIPSCYNGYCVDRYAGTCNTIPHCSSELKKKVTAAKGLTSVSVTLGGTTGEVRKNATTELISRIAPTFSPTVASQILVSSTETGTFSYAVIDQVGESAFLAGVELQVCGADYSAACTASIVETGRRLDERDLLSVAVVTITYEVDDTAYNTITGNGLDSGGFEGNLAALLGIGAGNVTVSGVDGNLVVSITIVEEGDGVTPVGDEILTEIAAINAQLTTITNDLVAEIDGLESGDIDQGTVDLCALRTCNGRGDGTAPDTTAAGCNTVTGECVCLGDYWGINCETACTCENGRECVHAVCQCLYPEWGLRCEETKECTC